MNAAQMLDATKEETLVLVKPDAFARGLTGVILSRIEAKGYVLRGLKIADADRDVVSSHYVEHAQRPFFPGLVDYMTSGPIVVVVVQGDRVIEGIRTIVGSTDPTTAPAGTIRGDFGRDWGDGEVRNLVHASDSPESARREIALWFPELTQGCA